MNLVINWDVTPELIDGWKTPNLYGLLFVTGLFIGYLVIRRMFRKEGIQDSYLDKLVVYVVVATIVGARLGHVLFYGPYWDEFSEGGMLLEEGYFSHPMNIIKIWEGGLASHGGIFAVFVALVIYSRRVLKLPMMWILDKMVAPGAIGGCFIRLGNLVNSEIVGITTDVPWAFSFKHYINPESGWPDPRTRHPAQLYEAIVYLLIFVILIYLYKKREMFKKPGVLFGTFLILLFGSRFMIEFVKLGQTARDEVYAINTGQMLSIPFILAGIAILVMAIRKPAKIPDISHLQSEGFNSEPSSETELEDESE